MIRTQYLEFMLFRWWSVCFRRVYWCAHTIGHKFHEIVHLLVTLEGSWREEEDTDEKIRQLHFSDSGKGSFTDPAKGVGTLEQQDNGHGMCIEKIHCSLKLLHHKFFSFSISMSATHTEKEIIVFFKMTQIPNWVTSRLTYFLLPQLYMHAACLVYHSAEKAVLTG